HQLHVPGHAGDADAVVAHGPDDARHVRTVADRVHGVVVVVVEVPAHQVIDVFVPVVADSVRPASLRAWREDVGGVDAAVAVDVLDQGGVARIVQVAERDVPVAIDVDQLRLYVGGDLALVEPDVLVQIRVIVVDAGVHQRHDRTALAGREVPRLGG